ncbi:hypothetical protein HXZ94_07405 [Empedobacter falsenii]|uniref:hypothetical protein n=1 Tax=Empedobacter falsenii TaxID=343874 RepID=UPI002574D604|nr:hypothetical protein [Empedobacter falsenii]MDM1298327.1 hypothetical protein [Empedobacter falsenii]MDM1318116.1 hypothetical protein [Empedobacter falsenii]
MKPHEFINLPISEIEQYSMIVPLTDLEVWKQKGWKTYQEIGLPEGDEDAWMLYGEFNKETDILIFNKPESISEVNPARLIGRKITTIKDHVGTYGMGGPGYFGILLDDDEYLVYAVWFADRYVNFSEESDIIGAVIIDFKLEKNTLQINLNNQATIDYDFHVDYVFDEEATEEKPDDIAKYLYFKLKEANFIV